MFQSVVQTIFIDVIRHVVGSFLDEIRTVAHGNSDAAVPEHLDVVVSVTDPHRFFQSDAMDLQQLVDSGSLGDAVRNDIDRSLVPVGDLGMSLERIDFGTRRCVIDVDAAGIDRFALIGLGFRYLRMSGKLYLLNISFSVVTDASPININL